jgi:hypothetical protein
MKDLDRKLTELARRQHQVFSRAQARAIGLSPNALYRRLQSGSLVACGTSALHFAGATPNYRGRLMAGLLDLGPEALVSGRAAAHLLGLDGFGEGPLEFLAPRSYRSRRTAGVLHTVPSLEPLDRVVVDGLACTSVTMTVIQLLAHASKDEAANALDSGCRQRTTGVPFVRRRLDSLGRLGRAGVVLFERIVAEGVVESWLERKLLAVLRAARLPLPAAQRRYTLAGFGVVRVDFEFADVPVVIEVGGRRGYLSFAERQRQEQRRNALQLEGKVIYFFTRDDVVNRPAYVAATVAAALGVAARDRTTG